MSVKRECSFPRPDFSELFKWVGPKAVADLRAIEKTARCAKGKVLYAEHQEVTGAYWIHSGKVTLSVTDDQRAIRILRVAQAPDIIGLWATLSGNPYIVTAKTVSACQLGFIKREEFIRYLSDHGEFTFHILRLLSEDVITTFEQARSLHQTRFRAPQ